jgi:TRAP transporter TAXI family solute receptor
MSKFIGFVFAACLVAVGTSASAQATNPGWPKSLIMGTAAPGGVYYVYGEAVAKLLTESLKIDVNPLPSQGPVHNVKLVESGGAQLGMVTMGIALQGWNGKGDWTDGRQFRKMRATFPMYDTTFHVVVFRRSGISSIEQLDKKPIGAGPRAGTPGTYVPAIMNILGIAPQIYNESWVSLVSEMIAGRRDALATMAGVLFPAVQDLEKREPITFVGLSSEQIDSVRKAMPELSSSTLPARTYASLEKDYVTFGMYNFMIARDDLPNDLVYQLVKAIDVNHARLVNAHPSAAETLPQNADKDTFLPFHPGAVRYYREIGIKIPDALVPTN